MHFTDEKTEAGDWLWGCPSPMTFPFLLTSPTSFEASWSWTPAPPPTNGTKCRMEPYRGSPCTGW